MLQHHTHTHTNASIKYCVISISPAANQPIIHSLSSLILFFFLLDFTKWTVPAAGAPAAPITVSIAGNGSNCLITASQVGPGNTKCDPTGKGCATIGACAGAPLFSVKGADIVTASGTVCIDFEQGVAVQLYPCVQSSNQGWHFDAEVRFVGSLDAHSLCCTFFPSFAFALLTLNIMSSTYKHTNTQTQQ